MKKLTSTTSRPGFMGATSDPLVPKGGECTGTPILRTAYIHGDAESLAGYDIPIFLDGDMGQLDLPVEEQEIEMLLPDGNHNCKATKEQDMINKAYYITLKL